MKIAIYGSRHQQDYKSRIVGFLGRMLRKGDTLVIHEKLARYLSESAAGEFHSEVTEYDMVADSDFTADIAVGIGGDGTFLRTAQWVGDKEIPIVGVNTGHLGFLAPFTLEEADTILEDFRCGRCRIEERSLLRLDVPALPLDIWPYALNEVAVLKKDTASMISVECAIDRSPLADYLCDGLLVSTPTGSTGYNLSVGGPIVTPTSPSFIIAPIAAHSLTIRPLVVGDTSVLELKVNSRSSHFRISLDGRSVNCPCGTIFYLSRADFVVKSVQKPGFGFFATIREKLLWGTKAIKE